MSNVCRFLMTHPKSFIVVNTFSLPLQEGDVQPVDNWVMTYLQRIEISTSGLIPSLEGVTEGRVKHARNVCACALHLHPWPLLPLGGGEFRALHAQSRPSHSLGSASLLNLPCEGCMHDTRGSNAVGLDAANPTYFSAEVFEFAGAGFGFIGRI